MCELGNPTVYPKVWLLYTFSWAHLTIDCTQRVVHNMDPLVNKGLSNLTQYTPKRLS